MKNFCKVSAMVAVLATFTTFAFADSITFGSFASGTAAPSGYANTAGVNFDGSALQPAPPYPTNPSGFITSGTNATFATGTGGGIWNSPIGSSVWVSNNANSAPGGSFVAPNGYYTYNTSFNAVGGAYTGTLDLYADDTVAVYLNGNTTPIVLAGAIGTDTHCGEAVPDCLTLDAVPLSLTLLAGMNNLVFVVEQTGLSGEGLDFQGTFASPVSTVPTPEPGTLILLGTGLIGAAGALFRRKQV